MGLRTPGRSPLASALLLGFLMVTQNLFSLLEQMGIRTGPPHRKWMRRLLPEVELVVEVPGGGVAHDLASVIRAFQHRVVPEVLRHADQPQRREEILRQLHDAHRVVSLREENRNRSPWSQNSELRLRFIDSQALAPNEVNDNTNKPVMPSKPDTYFPLKPISLREINLSLPFHYPEFTPGPRFQNWPRKAAQTHKLDSFSTKR